MGKCQPGQTTHDYPQLDSNTVSLYSYAQWTFVPMRACRILAARRFNMLVRKPRYHFPVIHTIQLQIIYDFDSPSRKSYNLWVNMKRYPYINESYSTLNLNVRRSVIPTLKIILTTITFSHICHCKNMQSAMYRTSRYCKCVKQN